MKIVKEKLNEVGQRMSKLDVEKMQRNYEKVQTEGSDIIAHLRSNVLPKLDQDELIDFMENLREWIDDMIGEKEKSVSSSEWKDPPPPPRGDMDPKSWGDPTDERPREMGG